MTAARFCPACGAPLSPSQVFCSSCGAAIPGRQARPSNNPPRGPAVASSPPKPKSSSGGAIAAAVVVVVFVILLLVFAEAGFFTPKSNPPSNPPPSPPPSDLVTISAVDLQSGGPEYYCVSNGAFMGFTTSANTTFQYEITFYAGSGQCVGYEITSAGVQAPFSLQSTEPPLPVTVQGTYGTAAVTFNILPPSQVGSYALVIEIQVASS
jgi:hypothetical protein